MALNNPYVGPRPFRQDEQPYFFGRAQEAETLAGLVIARRASLLFAQSGAGKSSLLAAGVAPRLLHDQREVRGQIVEQRLARDFRIARVGLEASSDKAANVFVSSALRALQPQAAPEAHSDATLAEMVGTLLGTPNASPAGADSDEQLPFVLAFDQFEELFTRHTAFRDQRRAFFQQVRDALQKHDALRVLFSMREDYIAELTPYVPLLPDELRPRYRLERLKGQFALDAISEPARHVAAPRPYAPGVAEGLLANLLATDSEYVEPLLLQVVCKRLWAGVPEERNEILADDVKRYGDVDRALIDYYNAAVDAVVRDARTSAGKISARRVRRFFGEQLITPNLTRGLVYFDATRGTTAGLPNEAIEVLTRSEINILRGETRGGGRWYELSHDRLVRPVIDANAEWEVQNLTPLLRRTQEWNQRGRRDEDLLSGVELRAEHARQRQSPDEPLTALEQEFFERSKSFVRRAARAQRRNIGELGWALIFAEDDPDRDAVKLALTELLDHRRKHPQAPFPVAEYLYRSGETAEQFLARLRGLLPTGSSAESMPYYLLLAGDPERIPFEFQYGLTLQCAVGRLCFTGGSREENLLAYARYAHSVVVAETASWALPRRGVVFAPTHEADWATETMVEHLVHPILDALQRFDAGPDAWKVVAIVGDLATKDNLKRVLGGDRSPALLFVGSHGIGFPPSEADQQRALQGAIVCGDWKGPTESITSDALVGADDIADDARILGMIAVLFSEFGGGTPHWDNKPVDVSEPREVAPRPFVSRLSERLLGHPRGGALAIVGHVDTTWITSFDPEGRPGTEGHRTFVSLLARLMRGHTVGAAAELLSARYKQVISELVAQMLDPGGRDAPGQERLKQLMIEAVDIRNWIVLGDPAVYLPVEGIVAMERPTAEVATARVDAIMRVQAAAAGPEGAVGTPAAPPKEAPAVVAPRPADVATFNGIDFSTGKYCYGQEPLEGFLRASLGIERVEATDAATEDIKAAGEAFLSNALETDEGEVA